MITINITKAKAIGHDMRRAARAEEFKPLMKKSEVELSSPAAVVIVK